MFLRFCSTLRGCLVAALILTGCAGGSALAQAPQTAAAQIPGLVGWWPGEGNAEDAAGQNDGTLRGGTSFPEGKIGRAFGFDGKDDAVTVPFNSSLFFDHEKGSLTLTAWVYMANGGMARPLVDLKVVDSASMGWDFGLSYYSYRLSAGNVPPPGGYYFGPGETMLAAKNVVQVRTWRSVAMTFENGIWKLYVDGQLERAQPGVPAVLTSYAERPFGDGFVPRSVLAKGGGMLSFGRMTTDVNFPYSFRGMLDEVRLYNRGLSEQEIKALYMAEAVGGPRPATAKDAVPAQPTPEELAKTQTSERLLRSQRDGVDRIAVSQTGNILVCSYLDNEKIEVWDLESGRLAFSSDRWSRYVQPTPAISPDGEIVAIASSRSVDIIEMGRREHNGKSLSSIHGPFHNLVISPDGQHLIATLGDKNVGVFNIDQERLVEYWTEFRGVRAIAVSPDGRQVAGAGPGWAKLWTLEGTELKVLMMPGASTAPLDEIGSLAFSPDGKKLAAGGKQGTVRLWDLARGMLTQEWRQESKDPKGFETTVAFTPRGDILMVGLKNDVESKTELRDIRNGKVLQEFPAAISGSAGFYPDGRTLVAVGKTKLDPAATSKVSLWDIRSPYFAGQPDLAPRPEAAPLPEDSVVLQPLSLEALRTGPIVERSLPSQPTRGSRLALSPDNTHLAFSSMFSTPYNTFYHSVEVWNMKTGMQRFFLKLDGESSPMLTALAFSPDGRTLAVGYGIGKVLLVDVRTGVVAGEIQAPMTSEIINRPTSGVFDLAFSPDGKRLSAKLGSNQMYQWELTTPVRESKWSIGPSGYPTFMDSTAVSPDGQLIATTGRGGIDLWTAGGQPVKKLLPPQAKPPQFIDSVAFSPDSKTLASCTPTGLVKLWSVPDGAPIREWQQEIRLDSMRSRIAFSPAGDMLAVGFYGALKDGTPEKGSAQLWETRTGTLLRELPIRSVLELGFSADGKTLATLGSKFGDTVPGSSRIVLWDLQPTELALAEGTVVPPPLTPPVAIAPPATAEPPVTVELPKAAFAGRIFFHSNRDGNDEIYSMGANEAAAKRLTINRANDGGAVPSPSGAQVAFTSNRDGNLEIYRVDADGKNETRLTNQAGSDIVSSWGQNGLAFYSNRKGNYDIYLMDDAGLSLRQLTNHAAQDIEPALSRDGRYVAFATNRDGNYEIYRMVVDGAKATRLTQEVGVDREPSWSPDGKRIVWSRKQGGGKEDIYLMNADGSGQTRLTSYDGKDVRPTFSADGERIVFASDRDGNMEVYAMNLDGTNVSRLTKNSGNDLDPFAGKAE